MSSSTYVSNTLYTIHKSAATVLTSVFPGVPLERRPDGVPGHFDVIHRIVSVAGQWILRFAPRNESINHSYLFTLANGTNIWISNFVSIVPLLLLCSHSTLRLSWVYQWYITLWLFKHGTWSIYTYKNVYLFKIEKNRCKLL